jgi:hypothetical protein
MRINEEYSKRMTKILLAMAEFLLALTKLWQNFAMTKNDET